MYRLKSFLTIKVSPSDSQLQASVHFSYIFYISSISYLENLKLSIWFGDFFHSDHAHYHDYFIILYETWYVDQHWVDGGPAYETLAIRVIIIWSVIVLPGNLCLINVTIATRKWQTLIAFKSLPTCAVWRFRTKICQNKEYHVGYAAEYFMYCVIR